MYLAGMDYSSIYKNMPYQLYLEWADTRTNGDVKGISYNHYIYTDGYYQHGYPLAHAMGVMVKWCPSVVIFVLML